MVISIVNHKGGTGKTTTALNLGSALAAMGKRILLVDFDAQSNLTYSLGIHDANPGMAELLLGEVSISDILKEREGIHILPATATLADVEISIAQSNNRSEHFKRVLDGLIGYDIVLIDCPPSLSVLTINALRASDFVLIPLQMEVLSVRGLDLILNTVSTMQNTINQSLKVLGVVAVMVDGRKNLSREIIEYIGNNYSIKIFSQKIRSNVKASEAPSFGKSVVRYAPQSSSARDYVAFAQEFMEAIGTHELAMRT